MTKGGQIVPFGKYKDQLAEDMQCLNWLLREHSDTPERNALQILFLEDDFCLRFLEVVRANRGERIRATIESTIDESRNLITSRGGPEELLERLPKKPFKMRTIVLPDCFERGCDVLLEFRTIVADAIAVEPLSRSSDDHWELEALTLGFTACIEVKSTVGDDYPAVLRQMRDSRSACLRQMCDSRSDVLFLGEYTGVGATEAQFVRFFTSAGMTVVFRRDEALDL